MLHTKSKTIKQSKAGYNLHIAQISSLSVFQSIYGIRNEGKLTREWPLREHAQARDLCRSRLKSGTPEGAALSHITLQNWTQAFHSFVKVFLNFLYHIYFETLIEMEEKTNKILENINKSLKEIKENIKQNKNL